MNILYKINKNNNDRCNNNNNNFLLKNPFSQNGSYALLHVNTYSEIQNYLFQTNY